MAYDVTSSFMSRIGSKTDVPNRRLLITGSDYSDRVLVYPTVRKSAQEVTPNDMTVALANNDGHFNDFYSFLYKMVTSCTLNIGYSDNIIESDSLDDSAINGIFTDIFSDSSFDTSNWTAITSGGSVTETNELNILTPAEAASQAAFAYHVLSFERTNIVEFKIKCHSHVNSLEIDPTIRMWQVDEHASAPVLYPNSDSNSYRRMWVEVKDSDGRLAYIDSGDNIYGWNDSTSTWALNLQSSWAFAINTDYVFIARFSATHFNIEVRNADESSMLTNTGWHALSNIKDTLNPLWFIMGDPSAGGGTYCNMSIGLVDYQKPYIQYTSLWNKWTKTSSSFVDESSVLDINSVTSGTAFLYYKEPFDKTAGLSYKGKVRYNSAISSRETIFTLMSVNSTQLPSPYSQSSDENYSVIQGWCGYNNDFYLRYSLGGGSYQWHDGSDWVGSATPIYSSFSEDTDFNFELETDFDNKWRFILKNSDASSTHFTTPWVSWDVVSAYYWLPTGRAWFTVGDPYNDGYSSDLTFKKLEVTQDEYIPVFKGYLKQITFNKEKAKFKFKDKMWELGERKIGDSENPVTFTSVIPSDIAWALVTCYAPYNGSKDNNNPDINFVKFEEWSSVFSADSVLMSARYEGMKVNQALANLARMTESAIWVEGDGKLNFQRFSTASSLDITFTADDLKELSIDLNDTKLINKQFIAANYSVNSDYFLINVYDESSTSVNSFGLREDYMEDSSIWFVNSASALTIAQRRTIVYGAPPRKFDLSTMLGGVYRQIAETIRIDDTFFGITSEESWRIMGYNFNVDKGEVNYNLDGATVLQGFYLDTDKLDSEARIL